MVRSRIHLAGIARCLALLAGLLAGVPVGAQVPIPGSLLITELMIDPTRVPDSTGEWIELHNPTPFTQSLLGASFITPGGSFTITSNVTIVGGAYLLFARSTDLLQNGGLPLVPLAQVWGNAFSLSNAASFLQLSAGGQTIASVSWGAAPSGQSLTLIDGTAPNFTDANFLASTTPYGAGDFGTPGLPGPAFSVSGIPAVPEAPAGLSLGAGLLLVGLARRRRAAA